MSKASSLTTLIATNGWNSLNILLKICLRKNVRLHGKQQEILQRNFKKITGGDIEVVRKRVALLLFDGDDESLSGVLWISWIPTFPLIFPPPICGKMNALNTLPLLAALSSTASWTRIISFPAVVAVWWQIFGGGGPLIIGSTASPLPLLSNVWRPFTISSKLTLLLRMHKELTPLLLPFSIWPLPLSLGENDRKTFNSINT